MKIINPLYRLHRAFNIASQDIASQGDFQLTYSPVECVFCNRVWKSHFGGVCKRIPDVPFTWHRKRVSERQP